MDYYEYSVILVNSTNHAVRADKVLGNAGIACKLIPVPRQLSSDCGVCIRILQTDKSKALQILDSAKVVTVGNHDI
jgi:hypothetical protein